MSGAATAVSALIRNTSSKMSSSLAEQDNGERPKSSLEYEMNALLAVLNNNALAAALFLTMEVPMLLEPVQEVDDAGDVDHHRWRSYAQLVFAATAVVLHGICVFTACETTFVLNHVTHAFADPTHRDAEYERFRGTMVGARVEPISGISYIWGIVAGMIALSSRLGSSTAFGSPAGDVAGGMMSLIFLAIGLFAWKGVGSYVGRVHVRAAKTARAKTTERDHRGRKMTVETTTEEPLAAAVFVSDTDA